RYKRYVDDVRSALAWAMSIEGDVLLGITLTVRSAQLLFLLSRTDEGMRYASAAMAALPGAWPVAPTLRIELHLVHAVLLIHTRREMAAMMRALEQAGEIARAHGDRRLLALVAGVNWLSAYIRSDAREMSGLVQQLEALTADSTDLSSLNLLDRWKAHLHHL